MAESALEKLKRLTAERKAREAGNEASGSSHVVNRDGEGTAGSSTPQLQAEQVEQQPSEVLVESEPSTCEGDSGISEVLPSVALHPTEENESVQISATTEQTSEQRNANHPALNQVQFEIQNLRAALDAKVPDFANMLRSIHVKLKNDPNVVTLLKDEEIGVIVAGLEKHVNVTIVAPAAVKAGKRAKKEPIAASDL